MLARKTSTVGSSKRMHVTNHEDRLSNLPPEIISDILSCLPTKYAVRTSVLSRNWRYMWTSSIYNINIDDGTTATATRSLEDRSASFRNFVTQVLLRTASCDSSTRRLRSFDLLCNAVACQPADLETWIWGVLMRNAEILNISIRNLRDDSTLWCFTGWTSCLRELRLRISCIVKFPSNNCFPNLKWLFLGRHHMGSNIRVMTTRETSSGRAVLDFPVLEYLELWFCEWLDVNLLEIQAPELISFKSVCLLSQKSSGYERNNTYEIKICSPKLAMFDSFGHINNYTLVTPAVTYASFINSHIPDNLLPLRVHKVLKALPNLKSFRLTGLVIQAILDSPQGLVFPKLNEVKEAEVGPCQLIHVMSLVKALPSLESLSMNMTRIRALDHQALTTIVPEPKNVMSNLKRLHVYNFRGSMAQYDVVNYFLENASNLQEIIIWVSPCATLEKIGDTMHELILSKLKPGSGLNCEVQHARRQGYWAGLAPTLVMGKGGKTQLVTAPSVLLPPIQNKCRFS